MISIIVATDDDLLIGKKDSSNGMPWHNKEDLQHFKKTTLHQTILMGKTTYMAIGRPLPHRKTIVVTACAYYAGGFVWGSKEDTDYTPELIKLKEMILAYATLKR